MPASPPAESEVVALLRVISAQNEAIDARLAALQAAIATRRLSAADKTALCSVFPVIVKLRGDLTFSVRSLKPDMAIDNARKLGRLLGRAADAGEVGGYRVEAVGESNEGALWKLTKLTLPGDSRD